MAEPSQPWDLLVRNTSEVVTVHGHSVRDGEAALTPIEAGVVGISRGRVAFLGAEAEIPAGAVGPDTDTVDAGGGFVGPGFVDAHTHAIFAGERSQEFELRCQGASYLEIAKAGGGIINTVTGTRAATVEQLSALALPRLGRLLENGVTTAEVKSGYGLSLEAEIKQLEAVAAVSRIQPVELIPTLLCAHAIPPEHKADRTQYIDLCVHAIIPQIAKRHLARFCDVFAEESAFSIEEARRVLQAGLAHGLRPKIHADQLSDMGAAQLAAEVKAISADHLEKTTPEGARALAETGVIGVLLPTATLFLRQRPFAPGRMLIDAGVPLALATNLNPGSAMSENVSLTLGLACLENGLTSAEAYWAFTRGAALAVGRPELGKLEVGGPADLVVFSCTNHRHLPYHLGENHARTVIKSGRIVVNRTNLPSCVVTSQPELPPPPTHGGPEKG